MHLKITAILLLLVVACSEEPANPWNDFVAFDAQYDVDHLHSSVQFSILGESKGKIDLNEASGIASSQINQHALWTHNDSGNSNYIYLLDESTAEIKATYRINGITNTDWEDIAVGDGKKTGEHYIYLADIGDNTTSREQVKIFVFTEPIFIESHRGKIMDYYPTIEILQLTYPDGAHNAETIMLDPTTQDIYIVSKYGERSIIYVARYPHLTDSIICVRQVGSFPFREVTAGNISADGKEVLMKNYEKIFYWNNSSSLPIWKLLSTEPQLAPYNPVEPQGEGICFNGSGYFTISEKKNSVVPELYFYSRVE